MEDSFVTEEDIDFYWSQHPELDREEVREILEICEQFSDMYIDNNDEAS